YQRGYRWTELEVGQLLDDIYDFINNKTGGFYRLQPVVVTSTDDNRWEVIDGQQRLTTIFIILAYLGFDKYNLDFMTRPGSKGYLLSLGENTQEDYSNIDYLHISRAFISIKSWFEDKKRTESTIGSEFHFNLGKKVKFIWYEVREKGLDPVKIFTRLNIGKIPLTNSELIKALLLNDKNFSEDPEQAYLEKTKIATEWDRIEQELHQEELWAYLNKNYTKSSTRIDFLFNFYLLLKGHLIKNAYDVFDFFEKSVKEGKRSSYLWNEIKDLFMKLREWFNNPELFHLTGYLITKGHSLPDLYNRSIDKRKSSFKEYLKNTIADQIHKINIRDLDYETHKKELFNVLLLFNIITILNSSNDTLKFSFYRFKSENWSLEHIHAQHSQGLNKVCQWQEWLKEHSDALKRIQVHEDKQEVQELITRIDELIEGNVIQARFEELFNDVIKINNQGIEMHGIGNMVLLDKDSNSSLSNSVFEVKRSKIIELDKIGSFILPATRNVFLKYYTKNPDHLFYWTERDQSEYVDHIEKTIDNFLGRKAEREVINEQQQI
ncbi:MAG: DUF262 domain-containing protein, partial [Nitrospirae bacterium]|nr:DUF262 domain-containing protein [Nitrospirota bacterium]